MLAPPFVLRPCQTTIASVLLDHTSVGLSALMLAPIVVVVLAPGGAARATARQTVVVCRAFLLRHIAPSPNATPPLAIQKTIIKYEKKLIFY